MNGPISQHDKIALAGHFGPIEVIANEQAIHGHSHMPPEGRYHIWGYMEGYPVDICIDWGGVRFDKREIRALPICPPDTPAPKPKTIISKVCEVLGMSQDMD